MPQYKVQEGDTIYSIAKRYGADPSVIMEDSNLTSDAIFPGQDLKVYSEGADIPQAAVTENMLMESPEMSKSTYNAELLGNETLATQAHGDNNQTIGAGLDFSSEGSKGINIELARRAGIPESTIQQLVKGGTKASITDAQAKEASDLRYAKAFSDAKNIPGFETANKNDQEFLADLVYNGAIKKSGYDKNDITTKELWSYLKDGDIAGAKKVIRTSNNSYAKTLYERTKRAGYSLITNDEFFGALEPIADKFDSGDLNGILDYVSKSNDRAVVDTAKQLLGVNDLTSRQAKEKLAEFIQGAQMMPTVVETMNVANPNKMR